MGTGANREMLTTRYNHQATLGHVQRERNPSIVVEGFVSTATTSAVSLRTRNMQGGGQTFQGLGPLSPRAYNAQLPEVKEPTTSTDVINMLLHYEKKIFYQKNFAVAHLGVILSVESRVPV